MRSEVNCKSRGCSDYGRGAAVSRSLSLDRPRRRALAGDRTKSKMSDSGDDYRYGLLREHIIDTTEELPPRSGRELEQGGSSNKTGFPAE